MQLRHGQEQDYYCSLLQNWGSEQLFDGPHVGMVKAVEWQWARKQKLVQTELVLYVSSKY